MQVEGEATELPTGWRVSAILFRNKEKLDSVLSVFTVVVVAAVPVGELQLDDGGLQAGSDPADLSLGGETVVLQLGGGDDGVGREHGPVTGLTALL